MALQRTRDSALHLIDLPFIVNLHGRIMVYSWLNNIQYRLLPGRCILCRGDSGRNMDICPPCEQTLCASWPHCRHCGLPGPTDTAFCGHCSTREQSFNCCIALAPYRQPLDGLITDFKYRRRLSSGVVLAQLLAQRLRNHYLHDSWPGALLPVPLHWRRQWRRGFNQAHFLAAALARELQLPLQANALQRGRHTPSQQGMNRKQRQKNLRGAFTLECAPAARHIALVDDVVTTGTTAGLISELLLDGGATRVDIWCLGRTPPPRVGPR